jgi:hypothetical protein
MGNRAIPTWLDRLGIGALIGAATICGGCTAVTLAGKAVSTTVGVAADVTAATVRGTGTVAAAAVGATSNVTDESLRAAARLSKTGSVVFFDPRTGAVFETPWKEGMRLLGAAESAKVDAAFSAVRVIRKGQAIDSAGQVATLAVKPGDVVELARGN